MAVQYKDRVRDTSTTTGTGNLTLSGTAPTGRQSFNTAFGTSVQFYYCIEGAAEWEVGEGHLSASTTLVRDTVLASSNAGAAVSFSAGTKNVFCTIPAGLSQRAVLTADFSKTNNTFSNVTDLTFNLAAGGWYRIKAELYVEVGPGQAKFDINGGSATITGMRGEHWHYEDTIVGATGAVLTDLVTFFGTANLGTNGFINTVYFSATLEVNAAGTLIVRFAQENTNATPSKLLKYSTFIVERCKN